MAQTGGLRFLSLSRDHCDPHGMIGTELTELKGVRPVGGSLRGFLVVIAHGAHHVISDRR
jgi:hypothetical protein